MQRALRNLCLVGRIAGQELRAAQQVGDDGWRVMVIDAGTGKAYQLLVLCAQLLKQLTYLELAHALGQLVVASEAEVRWDVVVERVEAFDACCLQHLLQVRLSMGEILIHLRFTDLRFTIFRRILRKP